MYTIGVMLNTVNRMRITLCECMLTFCVSFGYDFFAKSHSEKPRQNKAYLYITRVMLNTVYIEC